MKVTMDLAYTTRSDGRFTDYTNNGCRTRCGDHDWDFLPQLRNPSSGTDLLGLRHLHDVWAGLFPVGFAGRYGVRGGASRRCTCTRARRRTKTHKDTDNFLRHCMMNHKHRT
jgi:hypothetical protein